MPLLGLSWDPKLLCLPVWHGWGWSPPASPVSFTFLLSPWWAFSIFDVSSVCALMMALGSSVPLLISLNKPLCWTSIISFILLQPLSLCFPTCPLQPHLNRKIKVLWSRILEQAHNPEPLWHNFGAHLLHTHIPSNTLQRHQGPELLCVLWLGLCFLLPETWLHATNTTQPHHISSVTRLQTAHLMKQGNPLWLCRHFSHTQNLLRWHKI